MVRKVSSVRIQRKRRYERVRLERRLVVPILDEVPESLYERKVVENHAFRNVPEPSSVRVREYVEYRYDRSVRVVGYIVVLEFLHVLVRFSVDYGRDLDFLSGLHVIHAHRYRSYDETVLERLLYSSVETRDVGNVVQGTEYVVLVLLSLLVHRRGDERYRTFLYRRNENVDERTDDSDRHVVLPLLYFLSAVVRGKVVRLHRVPPSPVIRTLYELLRSRVVLHRLESRRNGFLRYFGFRAFSGNRQVLELLSLGNFHGRGVLCVSVSPILRVNRAKASGLPNG